jgi:hypothetical protein
MFLVEVQGHTCCVTLSCQGDVAAGWPAAEQLAGTVRTQLHGLCCDRPNHLVNVLGLMYLGDSVTRHQHPFFPYVLGLQVDHLHRMPGARSAAHSSDAAAQAASCLMLAITQVALQPRLCERDTGGTLK